MTSEEKADQIVQALGLDNGEVEYLTRAFDKHEAEANANQREKLAGWMLANGIATGHGDTIDDLLAELTQQINETVHKAEESQRERCKSKAEEYLESAVRLGKLSWVELVSLKNVVGEACLNATGE